MYKMGKTRFKLPPCEINPWTERPYSRHKWEIVPGRLDAEAVGDPDDPNVVYYYHVVCARIGCKLRNPERFRW